MDAAPPSTTEIVNISLEDAKIKKIYIHFKFDYCDKRDPTKDELCKCNCRGDIYYDSFFPQKLLLALCHMNQQMIKKT